MILKVHLVFSDLFLLNSNIFHHEYSWDPFFPSNDLYQQLPPVSYQYQQEDMLICVPLNSTHIHRGSLQTILWAETIEVSVGLNKLVETLWPQRVLINGLYNSIKMETDLLVSIDRNSKNVSKTQVNAVFFSKNPMCLLWKIISQHRAEQNLGQDFGWSHSLSAFCIRKLCSQHSAILLEEPCTVHSMKCCMECWLGFASKFHSKTVQRAENFLDMITVAWAAKEIQWSTLN